MYLSHIACIAENNSSPGWPEKSQGLERDTITRHWTFTSKVTPTSIHLCDLGEKNHWTCPYSLIFHFLSCTVLSAWIDFPAFSSMSQILRKYCSEFCEAFPKLLKPNQLPFLSTPILDRPYVHCISWYYCCIFIMVCILVYHVIYGHLMFSGTMLLLFILILIKFLILLWMLTVYHALYKYIISTHHKIHEMRINIITIF